VLPRRKGHGLPDHFHFCRLTESRGHSKPDACNPSVPQAHFADKGLMKAPQLK